MSDQTSSRRKAIGWASVAYAAFTALSIIAPILLDRLWSKKQSGGNAYSARQR
ncbi:MAG TPA: hypothetical protein VGD98_16960 [Ktedonobacteraceae bacterium]